jgi:hypothetical protein
MFEISPSSEPTFLVDLVIRFVINLSALIMLIRIMHVRSTFRRDFHFSYFALGMTVFLICLLLENVKLELGFALGLFAIFAIIRYRTFQIPIKEMTYLFVVIGVSVINALTNGQLAYIELVIVNTALVIVLFFLEKLFSHKTTYSLTVKYHDMTNMHALREKDLLADLEAKTGLTISRYQVTSVDYTKSVANVVVFFEGDGSTSQLGQEIKE